MGDRKHLPSALTVQAPEVVNSVPEFGNSVEADVSDQPSCPAAASHAALSAIHPYPLSAHVPEVTMGYTVVCAFDKSYVLLPHRFSEAVQKNPVPDQQSTEPHLQTPAFSEAPFPSEHAAAWLQVLEEDTQTSPVAGVQAPEAPQTQGTGLTVAPSP